MKGMIEWRENLNLKFFKRKDEWMDGRAGGNK